ncbi:hypothetical protein [uncultured Aggregatibacter sp.]|uniref:hypothetical protein n=1 Tax=uncultured Aggregatibacter sp. TaxID=470564 RepID=UPI00259A238E|nr:hypothetical protein [uncultured Aggregatibacter sp.]
MEQIDLEMVRGDDDGWTFDVSDEDGAVDLDGYRIDLHIKPAKGEAIKLSSTTGDIKTKGNIIYVSVLHEKTETVNWQSAQWDLQLTDSTNKVRTICGGEFVLIPDVTMVD